MTLPADGGVRAAAGDALEARLEELGRTGLARPASILFTEYLAALVAEGVIDEPNAQPISNAYHRAHYAAADADDHELREALAQLDAVAAKLAAMPAPERSQLADRVRKRLQPTATSRLHSVDAAEILFGSPISSAALPAAARDIPEAITRGTNPAAAAESPLGANTSIGGTSAGGRRPLRLRSLPLEIVAIAVVGLFFAGYFLRHNIDAALDPLRPRGATSGRTRLTARDIWRHPNLWVENLRSHALQDAASGRDQPARMAYELVLQYEPHNADTLNSLAWLCLTSHDPAVRDSERGMELALRALALNRAAPILDTAAEAYFQSGNVDEAVKLEQEAIRARPLFPDSGYPKFRAILEDHLREYQAAPQSRDATDSSGG